MKKIIFLLCLHNFVFSQIPKTFETPFIQVVGNAKREITPNIIHVSITLSEKSIDNKKYSIENQEISLNQILNELNIPSSKLTLTDLTSKVLIEKRRETGFKQNKKFNLILENASQVSSLFEKLFDANIKEADLVKLDHTEIITYNKEVRIEALKAAKAKVEYLLAAVDKKIGKPLEIIEIENDYNSINRGSNIMSNTFYSESPSVNFNSEFKKITITFSYSVKYSIE